MLLQRDVRYSDQYIKSLAFVCGSHTPHIFDRDVPYVRNYRGVLAIPAMDASLVFEVSEDCSSARMVLVGPRMTVFLANVQLGKDRRWSWSQFHMRVRDEKLVERLEPLLFAREAARWSFAAPYHPARSYDEVELEAATLLLGGPTGGGGVYGPLDVKRFPVVPLGVDEEIRYVACTHLAQDQYCDYLHLLQKWAERHLYPQTTLEAHCRAAWFQRDRFKYVFTTASDAAYYVTAMTNGAQVGKEAATTIVFAMYVSSSFARDAEKRCEAYIAKHHKSQSAGVKMRMMADRNTCKDAKNFNGVCVPAEDLPLPRFALAMQFYRFRKLY